MVFSPNNVCFDYQVFNPPKGRISDTPLHFLPRGEIGSKSYLEKQQGYGKIALIN